MPIPKGGKVLGQKREGNKLVLYVKDKYGKIKRDIRNCKCKSKTKPCKCK